MKDVFHFPRFLQLLERQWSEQKRGLIIGILAMTGGMTIAFGFALFFKNWDFFRMDGGQYVDYMITLFIAGMVFASLAFAELSTQPRGIAYLMNPASSLEKMMASLFFFVVMFFLVFNLAFFAVDYIMVGLAQHEAHRMVLKGAMSQEAYERIQMLRFTGERVADVGPVEPDISVHLFQAYFATQALFLLGSAVFKRFSFLLSVMFLAVFLILIGLYTGQMYEWILGRPAIFNKVDGQGLTVSMMKDGQVRTATIGGWGYQTLVFLFHYSLAPFFWIVGYFRLKEKEV